MIIIGNFYNVSFIFRKVFSIKETKSRFQFDFGYIIRQMIINQQDFSFSRTKLNNIFITITWLEKKSTKKILNIHKG